MSNILSVYDTQRIHLDITTIQYVEGVGNYSILHQASGKSVMVSKTLKTWLDKLPGFVRIHKKYLVNPQFIASHQLYARKLSTITLTTGEVLVVSRRRAPAVLAVLTQS